MYDDALRLMIFFGAAAVLWGLSLKFGMTSYGRQRIVPLDFLFLTAGLAMIGLYELLLAPAIISFSGVANSFTGPLRDFFAGTAAPFQLLGFLLVTDFLAYWVHRLMHTSVAWRFHAFHHSPVSLNWLSGMRGSPVHYILNLAPGTLAASLCLFSSDRWLFFALAMIDVLSQHFSHSNLRLPRARQLEFLMVTPRMHFVHHHPDVRFANSNYGFYFSIWDHLFGTYVDADTVDEKGKLGLDYPSSCLNLFIGIDARRST